MTAMNLEAGAMGSCSSMLYLFSRSAASLATIHAGRLARAEARAASAASTSAPTSSPTALSIALLPASSALRYASSLAAAAAARLSSHRPTKRIWGPRSSAPARRAPQRSTGPHGTSSPSSANRLLRAKQPNSNQSVRARSVQVSMRLVLRRPRSARPRMGCTPPRTPARGLRLATTPVPSLPRSPEVRAPKCPLARAALRPSSASAAAAAAFSPLCAACCSRRNRSSCSAPSLPPPSRGESKMPLRLAPAPSTSSQPAWCACRRCFLPRLHRLSFCSSLSSSLLWPSLEAYIHSLALHGAGSTVRGRGRVPSTREQKRDATEGCAHIGPTSSHCIRLRCRKKTGVRASAAGRSTG
eukprot:scaffold24967_cov66-Phaeocystis_antarctica.AAC.5